MKVTAGEECQHSCESVRVVPSSRGKAREIALGSHEMKKQKIYPEVIAYDPEGTPPTNEVDQIRLEAARKTQKTEVADCRTAVAKLERELYFAKKDLEKAYRACRPIQGEFYRKQGSPGSIIKVVQVVAGDSNKVSARGYNQRTRQLSETLHWKLSDQQVGYFPPRTQETRTTTRNRPRRQREYWRQGAAREPR
eukprot:scaffold7628_cov84-Cylindrotheca_fusiformis.AAC.3